MSAKYRSPSFLLPNELNTSANPANDTGINSLYSMDFDGTNNIDCGNISALNGATQATWSCWYRKTVNASPYFMGTWGDVANTKQFIAYQYNTGMAVYMGKNTSGSNASHTMFQNLSFGINVNTWYHMAFVFDASESSNADKLKFYLNGTQITNTVAGGALTSLNSVTSSFDIGGPTTLQRFTGNLDEVAIFNRALNSTERAALYDGTGSNIRPSNLMATNLNPVAYYPLGEQAQNTGYVGSGNPGNPTTLSNVWQFPNGVLQDYVMDFNIAEQSVDIANDFHNYTEMSVSVWVNFNNFSGYQYVFSAGDASAGVAGSVFAIAAIISTGEIYSWDGLNLNNTGISVILNTWNNILVTQTGTTRTVFINGQQAGNSFTTSALNLSQGTAFIGKYLAAGFSANAKISNVAIWNSDQSTNIADIYNNGSPQTSYTVSPQNWWKLNATSVYTPSVANYSTALSFVQSQTDSINCGNDSSLTPSSAISISSWIKTPYATLAYTSFVDKWNGTGYMIELGNSGTRGRPRFQIGNQNIQTTITVHDDKWHHIVATCDGTTAYIYVDGNQEATGAMTLTGITTSDTFNIGGGNPSTSSWDGEISNLALFDSALTSTQVSTLFNFGTPETAISFSPTSWWKLDNITTGLLDSGSASNNGTNSNPGATQTTTSVAVVPSWKIPDASGTSNGVSTTLPSTALQQSDLQFDSPYSNYSLSFDGTGDYIDCTDISYFSGADRFTLSTWFKVDSSDDGSANRDIISKGTLSAGTTSFLLRKQKNSNGNKVQVAFDEGATNFYSTTQIQNDIWYHVIIVYKGYESNNADRLNIYVDGVDVTASYTNTVPTTLVSSTQPLRIARWASGTDFYGNIDETAIWQSALTDAQVLQVYNNGIPNDITSLSPNYWWRLGENAYFDNNSFIVPNSITGAPNGTGSGSITSMISADAPGTYANGIGTNLDIIDRVGEAALSTSNSQSYNMIPSDISPYVPEYVGTTIANAASMTFDGVDDYFNAGNISSLQGASVFTISSWIKVDSTGANRIFGSWNATSSSSRIIGFAVNSNNTLLLQISNDGTVFQQRYSTSTIPLNTWKHVAVTFSSGAISFYIDGVKETPSAFTITQLYNISSNYFIGALQPVPNSSFYMDGQIDEVAIFNYALTADQVKFDIYEPTKSGTGLTANLDNNPNLTAPVAWYRMGD